MYTVTAWHWLRHNRRHHFVSVVTRRTHGRSGIKKHLLSRSHAAYQCGWPQRAAHSADVWRPPYVLCVRCVSLLLNLISDLYPRTNRDEVTDDLSHAGCYAFGRFLNISRPKCAVNRRPPAPCTCRPLAKNRSDSQSVCDLGTSSSYGSFKKLLLSRVKSEIFLSLKDRLDGESLTSQSQPS